VRSRRENELQIPDSRRAAVDNVQTRVAERGNHAGEPDMTVAAVNERQKTSLFRLGPSEINGERRPPGCRTLTAGQIPRELLIQYLASTFILVLNWWAESTSPLLPEKVNNLFCELVLPTVAAAWE